MEQRYLTAYALLALLIVCVAAGIVFATREWRAQRRAYRRSLKRRRERLAREE